MALDWVENKMQRDHLASLYFREHGRYDSLSWETMLAGDPHSQQAQMVTLHEGFHADLDRTTDYGSLLTVYAYLAAQLPETRQYSDVFNSLIKYCKRTHETFATYLSVFLLTVNAPDAQAEIESSLLDYSQYQRLGERLVQGVDGAYLRFHAALSALRVCMQGPVTQRALRAGLTEFRIRDLGMRNYPDERLRMIEQVLAADPQFWQHALEEAQRQRPDWQVWNVINASTDDPALFHQLLEEEHTSTSAFLMTHFQQALANRLLAHGMESLPYDGHMPFVSPLLAEAEKLVGSTIPGAIQLVAAEQLEEQLHERVSTVMNFAEERLMIRSSPLRGSLFRLSDGSLPDWRELLSGSGERQHFYLVTRPAHRLLEQYSWDADDETFLQALGNAPLCWIQRSGEQGGQRVAQMYLCDEPQQVISLATEIDPQLTVFSNLSMATLVEAEWVGIWGTALAQHTQPMILFDMTPFHHFSHWQKQNTFRVRYGTINLHAETQSFVAFACKLDDVLPWPLIAPCSSVVAKALQIYITEMLPPENIFAADESFIHAESEKLTILLSHLTREERFFDFNACRDKLLSF
jgi:hypothetical protein